jgi:hypothetical protein
MRKLVLLCVLFLSLPLVAAPIASAPMNIKGLEIDLLSVERRANVLTVKWAVRNTGDNRANAQFALVENKPSTYAVDEDSGTKYFVLTDKEGNVLATEHVWVKSGSYGINDDLDPGATQRYWMKLPAPPPAVKNINLFFTDAAEPFEAVAITDK